MSTATAATPAASASAAAAQPQPRFLVLHCYPGGLDGSAPWARGSAIWIESLALDPSAVDVADVQDAATPLPDAARYAGIVVTGSPSTVYERDAYPWIARLEAYLQATLAAPSGPAILGGCFGAQVLAQALGGRVESAGYSIFGTEELEPLPALAQQDFARGLVEFDAASGSVVVLAAPDSPAALVNGYARPATPLAVSPAAALGGGCATRLGVLMSHGDAVKVLPPGATLLARSKSCGVELFLCGRALGIQGHPEFSVVHEMNVIETREGQPMQLMDAPRHHSVLLAMQRRFLDKGVA